MSTLRLELAQHQYAVHGVNGVQASRIGTRFDQLIPRESSTSPVDITFERSRDASRFVQAPAGPVESRISLFYEEKALRVEGVGFVAHIDRGTLDTHVRTCREDEWFLDGFENLLRIVASYQSFGDGALVLHSAAIGDEARAFVFCGRSGAGKTTLCRFADDLGLRILSDELNLIRHRDACYEVQAMPFAGDFGRTGASGPAQRLTALFGLRQSHAARIEACSRAEAVSRIVASCPYLNADPFVDDPLADRVIDLVKDMPLRILSFAQGREFWEVLNHEYSTVEPAISC